MDKVKSKLLADYKKANKQARLKILVKYNFKNEEEFFNYCNNEIKTIKTKVSKVKDLPTIHNVHILDASGSMSGAKFNNAIIGINQEIIDLASNKEAKFTQTIVDFSGNHDIHIKKYMQPINLVGNYTSTTRGATALYQAIGETLSILLKDVKKEDKVLVKIFTDGEENDSVGVYKNPQTLKKLIKECENKGFTITFVGTSLDVKLIIKELDIESSNTLVHDNTAKGIEQSFRISNLATKSYTSKVAKGEKVLKGFYKQVGTLD